MRGAKAHTSYTPQADELIVIPTRALAEGEEDWAIAFAVPVATPGVKLFCSDFLHADPDPWTRPVSARHKMVETLTVFDDVFVPTERIFLDRDTRLAGQLALTFVEYHRFTAVSYKLPLIDCLVGLAVALAEANGIQRAGHVRDKLIHLVGYAETVRGLTHLAADRFQVDEPTGIAYPDPLTTNLAKWQFARGYVEAVEQVIDIAGGLLVTGPSGHDWRSEEVRPYLEKYLAGAIPASERLALMNLVERPARPRVRRLPGRSRRARGRLARGREAHDRALVRLEPCRRLRAGAGRAGLTRTMALPPGYRFRPARDEDAGPVAAFANEECEALIGARVYSATWLQRNWTAPSIDRERDVAVVEGPDGALCGYFGVGVDPPYTEVSILGIVALPCHGRGIGAAVVAESERRARRVLELVEANRRVVLHADTLVGVPQASSL